MPFKWLRLALVSKLFAIGAAVLAEAGSVGNPDVQNLSISSYPSDAYDLFPVVPTVLASAFAVTAAPAGAQRVAMASPGGLLGLVRVEAAEALHVVYDSPTTFAAPPFGEDGVRCISIFDSLLAHLGGAGWNDADRLRLAGAGLGVTKRDVVAGFALRPDFGGTAVDLQRAIHDGLGGTARSFVPVVICSVAMFGTIFLPSRCARVRRRARPLVYARSETWGMRFFRMVFLRGMYSRFEPQEVRVKARADDMPRVLFSKAVGRAP